MPRGDRTGPIGLGPLTGRGAGFCSDFRFPGYLRRGRLRIGFGITQCLYMLSLLTALIYMISKLINKGSEVQ